jgi:hypothetical protein
MENRTSQQAYEEYQRLKIVEEKLSRDNKGINLLSPQKSSTTFRIRLYKKVEGNLKTMTSKIVVNSNMPFMNWNFQNVSVDKFFEEFEQFVKLPIFKRFIKLNRRQKNQLGGWRLAKFRENIIRIEDVDISVGEQCSAQMSVGDITLFMNRIKKLISKQRFATESEEKDFNRYFFLRERVDDLERQIKKKSYSYYDTDKGKDKTIKITLTDEEYNGKLKLVEDELIELNKKYEFLSLPKFDYKEDDEDDESNPYEYEEDSDKEYEE